MEWRELRPIAVGGIGRNDVAWRERRQHTEWQQIHARENEHIAQRANADS
jgi:hypothetical protein